MSAIHRIATTTLVAMGLVAAGCASTKCGPENCAGCCESTTICVGGTATSACGTDGELCLACAGGDTCHAGVCEGPTLDAGPRTDAGAATDGGPRGDAGVTCSAASCPSGCCEANACVPYLHQTDQECGTAGAACAACTNGTATCQTGVCIAGCGPSSCDGCCSATGCIHPSSEGGAQSNTECGFGGGACESCPEDNACSDDGLCVDATSLDGGADGGGARDDYPCGTQSACLVAQDCCVTLTSGVASTSCVPECPNEDDVIACDGPEECPSGAPICCATEAEVGGTSPNCLLGSLGANCTTSCPTTFAQNCSGTNQVVLCHTSSECPDPSANQCCNFNQGSTSLTFCASSGLAFFANQCF